MMMHSLSSDMSKHMAPTTSVIAMDFALVDQAQGA